MLILTKRQKIALTVTALSLALLYLPTIDLAIYRQLWVFGVLVGSYLLSLWSLSTPRLKDKTQSPVGTKLFYDLSGVELVTMFVLPVLLSASFALFFLIFLPTLVPRLLLLFCFAFSLYIILLSENIFNVSAVRGIPLLRAAQTVGYLSTLFVSFAFYSLLFSMGFDSWLIGLIVMASGTVLFAQAFWQIELKENLSNDLINAALVGGLIIGQIAVMLTFWPLRPLGAGLALTTIVYVVLGLLQHQIKDKLNVSTAREYLIVGVAVFLLLILITNWPG